MQEVIPDKTNEIPRLAAPLHDVPSAGVFVTAGALHTQDDTAGHLEQERSADDLLVVNTNDPILREACARLYPEPVFP